MREINRQYGMKEGDRVLVETSEAITGLLGTLKEEESQANTYKVGSCFVIAAGQKIPFNTLSKMAEIAQVSLDKPFSFYGLEYAYFEK